MNINTTPPPPRLTDASAPDSRSVSSQPVNLLRITLIAFSLAILVNCGGGGGGGTATVTPTPPSGGGGGQPTTPQALPAALIANAATARGHIPDLTPPTTPTATATQAQQAFQSRVMDADTLVASDAYVVTPLIAGADVSSGGGVMIDGNTIQITLAEIQKGVEDRFDLTRFNSQYEPVMVHQGATLTQYRAAGRDGSDVFEYLSYGGWFTNSAFSVDMLTINDGSSESSLLVGVSYGDATGSRPTGTIAAQYDGPVVGVEKSSGDVIQGILNISISGSSLQTSGGSPTVTLVEFQNLANINDGTRLTTMSWLAIPITTDGTFSSTTGGDIDGAFFGSGHTEVGGTFNRDGIIGAFGGMRSQ